MRKRNPAFPELEKQILIKGITKKNLAEILNITPECLSRKLTGRVEFTLKEVKIVHHLFSDISTEKLFELD
ncbi:MAG: hypothetical protein PUJ96_00255 [Treponema sp.]|nr:hypothetical protein [Treponema sp.]